MAGAPNDVSYKNNTLTPGIFIHHFPKDVAVWPNGRVSVVDIEEIYSLMLSALCSVPTSKTAGTNTSHWLNQGKITNEFSCKKC